MTTTATAPAIEATGLSRRFGDVQAVDGVDLRIARGAVFGLLGPDGAGKSTLIRMLATVLGPDDGDARVAGHSVRRASEKVTPLIGYMSQQFSLYPDLTVAENIDFFAKLRGVPKDVRRTRMMKLLEGMGLAEFVDRQAGKLSGGMKQKLFLASTLMHEPDVLLLDEPTTGVDPVSRREFWRILAGLHRQGTTVLVATPYMDEAERCTEVAFLESGRIRHQGSPAQIKALVPGRLFEVTADDPRAALAALQASVDRPSLPGLLSVHLYGDVLRVLLETDDPASVHAALQAAGIGAEVRPAAVDMETAFAFLAELGTAA